MRLPPGRILLQIVVLLFLWLSGTALVSVTGLPLPGGIVALGLLLLLLFSRAIALPDVKDGADWLLAQMLLFFVPALLAVIDHPEFLGITGLKILFVIVSGTAIVMVVTALIVEFTIRRRMRMHSGSRT